MNTLDSRDPDTALADDPPEARPELAERNVVVSGVKIASAMNTAPRALLARAPLVVLPEIGFSWRDYRPLLEHYASERRVFALDWPGAGTTESPSPSDFAYDANGLARLLAGWMDGLGVGRAVLLGNGIGASAGLLYAAEQPQRVLGFIGLAPLGFSVPTNAYRIALRLLGSPKMLRRFGPTLVSLALGPTTDETRRITARYKRERLARGSAARLTAQAALWKSVASPSPTLATAARSLDVPAIEVRGALDPLVSAEDSTRAAAAIGARGSLEVVLPDAGHLPFLQQPERFYQAASGVLTIAEVNAGNTRIVR